MFTVNHALPGICHITDAMGVSFTLIEGSNRAILFDTGYGTEDVKAYVETLTDKPVTVYLSHGHHDHMLGARWFGKTFLCAEDREEFIERTGEGQRKKVRKQAEEQHVSVPEDFMTAPIAMPEAIRFTEKTGPFESRREDLGNTEVLVIRVPGHTPGSIVLYVPASDLLLTGDDWNPCTWMWFPTSDAANRWRDRMKELIRTLEEESGRNIRHVICSHRPVMREGDEIKGFLEYVTDERMKDAPAIDMGAPINTHEIRDDEKGWQLIFDHDKIKTEER
ncbi:MAG: MBL fold metallo-hydrolase [Clostridia bacterium]|jgi:glyoxylase-like metal-dependent hydrolase (beta-lactamase superfamily II)